MNEPQQGSTWIALGGIQGDNQIYESTQTELNKLVLFITRVGDGRKIFTKFLHSSRPSPGVGRNDLLFSRSLNAVILSGVRQLPDEAEGSRQIVFQTKEGFQ